MLYEITGIAIAHHHHFPHLRSLRRVVIPPTPR